MNPQDYDLDGVTFMEIEVEVTRTEKLVFALTGDDSMGTSGQPSQKVGAFMRTLNYWVMQTRNLGRSEHALLKGWKFLEHDEECEMWKGVGPNDPVNPCLCRDRILQRCEPGSLNGRRKRDTP